MKGITNVKVVLPDAIIEDGIILIEDGRIVYAGEREGAPHVDPSKCIDGKGLYAGPGFVDIHCHGYTGNPGRLAGHDPVGFASYHLSYGTTSVLAAVGAGESEEPVEDRIDAIRNAMKSGVAPSIAGIMVECYFTNFDFGAPLHYLKGIKTDLDAARRIFFHGDGCIRLMTVSLEQPGIEDIMKLAQENGVTLAVGHCRSTPEQLASSLQYGLCVATHHYCATGYPDYYENNFERKTGTRMAGIDEAVDDCDEVFAEIIPDCEGKHVHPIRCRLAVRCKGEDKIIIITDAAEVSEEPPSHINDAAIIDYRMRDGVLAGSRLTMQKACYNFARHTGLPVKSIFKMASTNPARAIGINDRKGSLTSGKDADVVLCDDEYNVKAVFLGGELKYCDI